MLDSLPATDRSFPGWIQSQRHVCVGDWICVWLLECMFSYIAVEALVSALGSAPSLRWELEKKVSLSPQGKYLTWNKWPPLFDLSRLEEDEQKMLRVRCVCERWQIRVAWNIKYDVAVPKSYTVIPKLLYRRVKGHVQKLLDRRRMRSGPRRTPLQQSMSEKRTRADVLYSCTK